MSEQPQDRLESWKEIGAYLQRDARTVRRWEKEEGLPVHRHSHRTGSSVYAYPSQIDAWRAGRKVVPEPAPPRPLWKILAFALTMLLCLIMVGNGVRPVSAQQKALTTRLLCDTGHCGDSQSDLSADGRWLVITDWQKTGDLLIRDLTTHEDRRLFAKKGSFQDNQNYAQNPIFSRDASQIAFLWDTATVGVNPFQLRVMKNAPGSEPRILLDNPEYTYFQPFDWSPDGKRILVGIEMKDKTWQIAWVNATDGSVTTVKNVGWRFGPGEDDHGRLSPDGRYIAYSALAVNPASMPPPLNYNKDRHIYVLAADGSSEVDLVRASGANTNPVWTADGHLLFTSDRTGSQALWSIAVGSARAKAPETLVSASTSGFGFVVSARGSYYYNENVPLLQTLIVEMEAGGKKISGNSPRILDTIVGYQPSWSPDGKQLAFTRFKGGFQLVVRNLETGEEKTFQHKLLKDNASIWLDDRTIQKTMVKADGSPSVFYLDLRTGQFTEVLQLDQYRAEGNPSPDFKTNYIRDREIRQKGVAIDRLVAVDIRTGTRRTVLELPAGRVLPGYRLSPKGDQMLLNIGDGGANILATVSIDGSDYHELYRGVDWGGINWAPDESDVFFAKHVEGTEQYRVMRIPVHGGEPVFTGLEVTGGNRYAFNPDGTRVAIAERKTVNELWALDNVLSGLK